jgi:hypothetical protein
LCFNDFNVSIGDGGWIIRLPYFILVCSGDRCNSGPFARDFAWFFQWIYCELSLFHAVWLASQVYGFWGTFWEAFSIFSRKSSFQSAVFNCKPVKSFWTRPVVLRHRQNYCREKPYVCEARQTPNSLTR